jgi:hypothetical protein
MIRALDDLKENPEYPQTLELTVYSLCPSEDEVTRTGEWRRERAAMLTASQTEVVRRFLRYVGMNVKEDRREWYGAFIDRALAEIWVVGN